MRRLIIVAAALLSACSSSTHTYVVETKDAASPVTSAVVSVCRRPEWSLDRLGSRFEGALRGGCEGSGHVRLSHADGTTTECHVGYVTTMDTTLAFVVEGRRCDVSSTSRTAEDAFARPTAGRGLTFAAWQGQA